jgi:hypothetical protein
MGRGRQKAKHTKVARELKYFSPETNYSALERELGHAEPASTDDLAAKWADLDESDDKYVDIYGDDDETEAESA